MWCVITCNYVTTVVQVVCTHFALALQPDQPVGGRTGSTSKKTQVLLQPSFGNPEGWQIRGVSRAKAENDNRYTNELRMYITGKLLPALQAVDDDGSKEDDPGGFHKQVGPKPPQVFGKLS